MKKYNVAILGATGAVGREMLRVLEERRFPIGTLRLLASARSAGKQLPFAGNALTVEEATPASFAGMDIVLGAAQADLAREMAPSITAAGAVFVDNSSAFRMRGNVPLVVPEINPEDAAQHRGIISNPNCSTIITLTAIAALHRLSPIRAIVASTYQAVSGAGAAGLAELEAQVRGYAEGKAPAAAAFPYPIAFNVIPQIGSDSGNGYTTEEMKMQNEGRKILHQPDLRVTCTCVRVPVAALPLDQRDAGDRAQDPRGGSARRHRQRAGMPSGRRPRRQALSDATRDQRSGSGVCRSHPRRSHK